MIRVTTGDLEAHAKWDSPVHYYWCDRAQVETEPDGEAVLRMQGVSTINGDPVQPVDLTIDTNKPVYIEHREEE